MSNTQIPSPPTNDRRKALGRGLDVLLPSTRSAPQTQPALNHQPGDVIREIPLDLIDRNPYQTRTRFDESALEELAGSIRESGVVQPIIVRTNGLRFQLVAGERRWLASQKAEKATIPAIVRQVSNEQAMEITIIENLQREDLNPMEQARAYERLAREFSMTQEQMAQRTGKERASVSNFLRLLKLPDEVQAAVEKGKLSFGHAKVLMMLQEPALTLKCASQVLTQHLSVRQTEALVHSILHPKETEQKKAGEQQQADPNVREAERVMQQSLGCRVQISDRKGKGKIVIEYSSLEDFDRIVEILGGQ